MRKLLLVATVIASVSATCTAARAEGSTGPVSPPPSHAQPPASSGPPGILVTPPVGRPAPPAGEAGASGDQSNTAPQDGGGGCKYVPRKLDLIV